MKKRTYHLSTQGIGKAFDGVICDCSDLAVLPLTYKTDWYNFEKVLDSGKLPFEQCDVFNEKLEYFFYGRPSYRIGQNNGKRRDNVYYPVCFLLNPKEVNLCAVFPFDSGAYADGRYDDYIHEEMDINNFLLNTSIQNIKGFIKYFYGDNYRYYTGKAKHIHTSPNNTSELNSYINLLAATVSHAFDERADTIEIISSIPVDLSKCVKAIIIPDDFCESECSKQKIQKIQMLGVAIITYDILGLSPGQYNGIVSYLVFQYLENRGLLKKGGKDER